MSKPSHKPIGEVVAGLVITCIGIGLLIRGVMIPDANWGLYIAVPLLVVGLIVLFSKDASKSGEAIFKYLSRL